MTDELTGKAKALAVLKDAVMWQLDCHVCRQAILSKEEPARCHPEALLWKSTDPWPKREHVFVGRGKKRVCSLCGRDGAWKGTYCTGRPVRDHAQIDREIVEETARRLERERLEAESEKIRKREGAKARAARKKAKKLGLTTAGDVFEGH